MGNINWSRVVMGGVVAGIVMLLFDFGSMMVLGMDQEAWMAKHALTAPNPAAFVVIDVLLGIMIVWLYAAVRPRFGPGAGTAAKVAIFMWLFFTLVYGGFLMLGLFAQGDFMKMAAWGLLQLFAATFAGAWLYREEGVDTTARM